MTPKDQDYYIKGFDILLSRHSSQECLEGCPFCEAEDLIEDEPLEILVDDMTIAHKKHSREIGYPFIDLCWECRAEYIVGRKRNGKG